MLSFEELGLSEEILRVLKELGFENPTEIQEQAIPRLLQEDKDLIGVAQTGTGKTAAFGIPLLEKIDPSDKFTQGLILAPTRELGQQIAEQLQIFSKYQDRVNVLAVYGGAAIFNQIKALKKTQHVIIATPGRLIDLIKRKAVNLENLKYVVLDEADEMLNMGFKDELDEILAYTPDDKRTWLFSATMPDFIKKIVRKYMDDPIDIRASTKSVVNKNIEHLYAKVRQRDKIEALMRFLDIEKNMRGVVFCRTRNDTQMLAEALLQKNYKADALHGDLSQAHRDRVMKRFKKHELQVLVATDVAARGIDVNDITHVFHFTLPDDDAYYTHRSGRTARAGKEGISIAFLSGKEKYKINRLERALGINFEQVLIPAVEDIASIRAKNWVVDILESNVGAFADPEMLSDVIELFGDISREELIEKLLLKELTLLNLGRNKDLNDTSTSNERGGGRDDRRGGRSRNRGGGRDRGGRGGDRSRNRGGRGGRSGDRDRGGRGGDRSRSGDSGGGGRFNSRSSDRDGDAPRERRKDRSEDSYSSRDGGGYKKKDGDKKRKAKYAGDFAKKSKTKKSSDSKDRKPRFKKKDD